MGTIGKVAHVDKELMPDCCITCQEMNISGTTLSCNVDGVDVLPFYVCDGYTRLKMYKSYRSIIQFPMSRELLPCSQAA